MASKELEFENLDNFSSFSSAVNVIQDDRGKARKALIYLADRRLDAYAKVELMKNKLAQAESDANFIDNGIDNVFSAMKLKKPLALLMKNQIIVFSDVDVTIEENVL